MSSIFTLQLLYYTEPGYFASFFYFHFSDKKREPAHGLSHVFTSVFQDNGRKKSADRSALHLQELTHQHKDEVSRYTGEDAADGVS